MTLSFSPAARAAPKDAQALKLDDDAINNDYLATKFGDAEKKLKQGLAICGKGACSPNVVGQLHRDLAIIYVVASRPDVLFQLAAVVSGEAEADFEKGYRINLDGMRLLLEAIRTQGPGYRPRVVFTSSIAVFGAPFDDRIDDRFHLTPAFPAP